MSQTNDKSLKQNRSRQLYERAIFFRRLAVGAADPKFSAKLRPLVEEYESEAARVEREIEKSTGGRGLP